MKAKVTAKVILIASLILATGGMLHIHSTHSTQNRRARSILRVIERDWGIARPKVMLFITIPITNELDLGYMDDFLTYRTSNGWVLLSSEEHNDKSMRIRRLTAQLIDLPRWLSRQANPDLEVFDTDRAWVKN